MEDAAWTCPSCSAAITAGRYCSQCGERRLATHDHTLTGLLHEWFESVAHVDGRVFRSVRELLSRPGALTVAYLAGRRRPYLPPFQLFLLVNLLFFVSQSLSGLSVLTIPLNAHLEQSSYGAVTKRVVDTRVASAGVSMETFAESFDHREQTLGKSMVVLMAPLLALCAAGALRRERRQGATHLVFGVHFYAFMLLFLALLFPLLAVVLRLLQWAGLHFAWSTFDDLITLIEVAAIVFYIAGALGAVYGLAGLRRAVPAFLLVAAVIFIFLLYRISLLGLTLLTL